MKAESRNFSGTIKNPLADLEDAFALQIVRLACASNDLATNHEALSKFPDGENAYFFYNSISIVREIAKLIVEISNSGMNKYFSSGTESSFSKLSNTLSPFDESSLSKSVLKPIRDVNFHYNFPNEKSDAALTDLTIQLKGSKELAVAVNPNQEHLMSLRYTFADWFRNEYINSHLDSKAVKVISAASVELIAFIDSLLADLMGNIDNEQ